MTVSGFKSKPRASGGATAYDGVIRVWHMKLVFDGGGEKAVASLPEDVLRKRIIGLPVSCAQMLVSNGHASLGFDRAA